MVHIVFGHLAADTLKDILKNAGRKKERVITLEEMFSVGPILHLHNQIGLDARIDWMKNIMGKNNEECQEYFEAINQIKHISEDQPILIWISENSSEQTGLRYVLYLMKDKANKIKIINTSKKYEELFSQHKIQYIVRYTGEIAPAKFQIVYQEAEKDKQLNPLERNHFEAEWTNLAESWGTLRIWLNGRIQNVAEEYYDQYMIEIVKKFHNQKNTEEYIKVPRIIGEMIGSLEQHLGAEFLEYRLKKLIKKGVFEVAGSIEDMRAYKIKLRN